MRPPTLCAILRHSLTRNPRVPRKPRGSRVDPLPAAASQNPPTSRALLLRQQKRTYATSPADLPQQLRFGQPTFETHPHLLKSGEITPNCTAQEYADRRSKLAAQLPEGSIAILPAAEVKFRSGPVFYGFQQDPEFLWVTGFEETGGVCVIEKGSSRDGGDGECVFHLFVRGRDEHAELWEGARSGVQAAVEVFNADEAGDIDNLQAHLSPLIARAKTIYISHPITSPPLSHPSYSPSSPPGFNHFFSKDPPSAINKTLSSMLSGKNVQPLKPILHKLRAFKSPGEVKNMRTAGKISGRAFNEAIQRRFRMEKDLWAFLEYRFRVGGCEREAYVPVVAGGENALTLHYTRNNDVLRDREMVLVDAGGQYGGYVTDITRTWPINGKFTTAQKDLYQAVLNVQKKCVALCRENAGVSLDDVHSVADEGLEEELRCLGFDVSGRVLNKVLFPHHVGHFVGLDVHDSGTYPRSIPLKAGQVVTVEPGIYVPQNTCFPKHFRGMGIRIEDTVYVDKTGPIVLSVEAVKEIVDIEALGERAKEEEESRL